MEQHEFRSTETSLAPVPASTEVGKEEKQEVPPYYTPQLFVIGTAVELMKNNISGHLLDGPGGGYVWGS